MDMDNQAAGLSAPRTAGEAGWHASRYNLMAKIPDSKKTAIFNTLSGNCAEYSEIELYLLSVLEQLDEDHPVIGRFARQGIIANFDEREALRVKNQLASGMAPNGTVTLTICPTLACNFECPYCFATLGSGKMSGQVQDDVVALAGRMLDVSGAKTLEVNWFGGEPLLALDVIESLTHRFEDLTQERGLSYKAGIFTNAYLLTPEVVDTLIRLHILFVHIPFDGVGATHDATRRRVGGGPTFDRILANLALLRPPIKTLVRFNTHAGNVAQLDELKDLVTKQAKDAGNRLSFYPAIVRDVGAADEPDRPMAEYAFHGIEVSLRSEVPQIPVGYDHACSAQNLWLVTIDDKGRLHKCGGGTVGQPRFAYGTAHDWDPADPLGTASNPGVLAKYLNTCSPDPGSACEDCVWLPLCGGGCPHVRVFGKRACPAYSHDPERFVLAMHSRRRDRRQRQC